MSRRTRQGRRILLICHVYPPEHAPAGVMTEELAQDLSAAGCEVTVVTGWPNHPGGTLYPGWKASTRAVEPHDGFLLIRSGHSLHARTGVRWRLWYYLSFALSSFVNGLFAGPVDSVFSLSTPLFGGWTAWLLARLRGARFVYGIFDLHPESAANAGMLRRGAAFRALRFLDTLLCRLSDDVVTLGAGLRDEIALRGIDPNKIRVVPLWLDGRKIVPTSRDNAWRRAHGIPSDRFVALYAGTIGLVSGAEVLIDAANALSTDPDILILCVGEGPTKDRLEAECARRELGNIQFLPFQPAAVLAEVQATADVGLVTLLPESSRTSVPSKVLGYMAAGRPVIASVSADSDTARMIAEAGCGRITEPMDGESLARAIRDLARDPAICRQLGERARRHFECTFDRPACVSVYKNLLEGQTAGPSSRPLN